MDTLSLIASEPTKTALCIGNISKERKQKLFADEGTRRSYIGNIRDEIIKLTVQGVDSFLFIAWGEYDILLLNVLRELDRCEYGEPLKSYIPMAVSAHFSDWSSMPDPKDHFQFFIDLEDEGIDLTPQEAARQLLSNVSYVLCDNTETEDNILMYLKMAEDAGKQVHLLK